MGKQHLTVLAWKSVARKHQVKDGKLEKALNAYDGLGEDGDVDARLKALEGIKSQAKDSKSPKGANAELDKYLDEVIDEAEDVRKTVAARQKTVGKKKEEEGEDEDGVDLKAQTIAAMKRVKMANGESGLPFIAGVARPTYGLILSRRVGAKHKATLREEFKATKFVTGECRYLDGAFTFIVEPLVGGLAKNLKKALKEQADQVYKVRVKDAKTNETIDDDADKDEDDLLVEKEREGREAEDERRRQAEAREREHRTAADKLAATVKRLTPTVAYALKSEPDEGVRILDTVRQELRREAAAFDKAYPSSPLRPKDVATLDMTAVKADEALRKKAGLAVSGHCTDWMGVFTGPLKRTEEDDDPAKRAKRVLKHVSAIEQGVHRDRGMLARMGISGYGTELDKVMDQVAVARGELEQLRPKRSSDKPPSKAPDVNRPAPVGVDDPVGWNKACDDIDLANAKGDPPKEADVLKMLEGAEQALGAAEWKWEADLKGKFKADWNAVKGEYKKMLARKDPKAKDFMSGYWWFRKATVDREMRALAAKYTFEWESVGSTNLESDYDISVKSHGTIEGKPFRDWQIVAEFNKNVSGRFNGVQPGTLFDTNLYASAPAPEPKADGEKSPVEREMDAATEAGQDVGALMKLRRYMEWEDYVDHKDAILDELKRAVAAEKDPARAKALFARYKAAVKQFDDADAYYFMSLHKTLENAGVVLAEQPSDQTLDGQAQLIAAVERLEHDEPDRLMAATNAAYLEKMEAVRDIEAAIAEEDKKPVPDADRRATLLADLKTAQSQAVYFAAEAYHSDGPYKHIVQAVQKSAQEVKAEGITDKTAAGVKLGQLIAEKLDKVSITQFLQSFNEQLGDFLKDLKHYEAKSPFPGLGFYRASKYLERLFDAMDWIGKKLDKDDPELAATYRSKMKLNGKTPAELKAALGALVAVRGGKVEFNDVTDPEKEQEAYSVDQIRATFGSDVQTLRDLGGKIKTVGKDVNAMLRKAAAGRAMVADFGG